MSPSLRIAIAAALLSAAFLASAQNDGRRAKARAAAQERLKAADADGDGYIDRAEADASLPRIAKNFDAIDADRDGRLSRDELRQAVDALRQRQR